MVMSMFMVFSWKRVFAMTSVFSWKNSISLCPASFSSPRPNLPAIPNISWLPTFAFQSPVMKRTSVCVCVCVCVCVLVLGGLHRTIQLQFLQLLRLGHRLGLLWYWMVWHGNELRSFCHFLRLHLSTGFQTLLLTMMATPFLLRDS